jgi:hypothetical protein
MQAGRREEKMPIMNLRQEPFGRSWIQMGFYRWLWDSLGFYFIELLLTLMTTLRLFFTLLDALFWFSDVTERLYERE